MARCRCSQGEKEHNEIVEYLLTHPEELTLHGNFLVARNVLYYEEDRLKGEIDLLGLQGERHSGLDGIVLAEVKRSATPNNMGKAREQLLRADMFLAYRLGLMEPEYQHLIKFGGFEMIKEQMGRRPKDLYSS
jgi:hypothetical protein